MLTLVIGGAASGKSAYAEHLAVQSGGPRYYLATMQVWDAECAAREAAGRLACLLAERADCVVQMFCGLPTVLKGELPPC